MPYHAMPTISHALTAVALVQLPIPVLRVLVHVVAAAGRSRCANEGDRAVMAARLSI